MTIIRTNNVNESLSLIHQYKVNKKPILIICTIPKITVYNTGRNDINLEYCQEYNIPVIPFISNGGSAISNVGDIGVYFGIKNNYGYWCRHVRQAIKLWLSTQGINSHIKNNDLTIHGKKFLGYTEHPNDIYSSGAIFIAMSNSQTLVNEICLKPKTRITAGLNEYGICASEIIDIIIEATNDYLNMMKGGS